MTIQVLVSTMHQTDFSLLDKMNIQTDAIIVNQCDKNEVLEFNYKGHQIKWISLAERGVGLSRNTALMRATADVLLFADDDVVYQDGFDKLVIMEYETHPHIDLIVFNFQSLNVSRPEYIDVRNHRLHWYNCLKYGAFRISIRKKALQKNNMVFSLLFGGGAPYQSGEDNLFLVDSLHKKIHAMASCILLGTVAQKESTWFKGYNKQYYYDRGFLFANMYRRVAKIILFAFELKSLKKKSNYGIVKRLKYQFEGVDAFNEK